MEDEEFKRVVLEIGECLRKKKITLTFQKILYQYEKEIQ